MRGNNAFNHPAEAMASQKHDGIARACFLFEVIYEFGIIVNIYDIFVSFGNYFSQFLAFDWRFRSLHSASLRSG